MAQRKRAKLSRGTDRHFCTELQLVEPFNQHKLANIIAAHGAALAESVKEIREPNGAILNISQLTIAQKYLESSRNGEMQVKYFQHNGIGRRYAVGSLSMQSMKRKLRHSICDDRWIDIDMKNAHSIILFFLCLRRGFRTPELSSYNANRPALMIELMEANHRSRDGVKQVLSSIMYGGQKDFLKLHMRPAWLDNLFLELKRIREFFAETDAECKAFMEECIQQGEIDNLPAKWLSRKCGEVEDDILMCMYNYFGRPTNCTLCFDGLQLLSRAVNLTALNDHVSQKFDFDVQFDLKPMDQRFELPGDIVLYKDPLMWPPFDFSDVFDFVHFQLKYQEKTFASYEHMLECVLPDYRRVMGRCTHGGGFFFKKEPAAVDVTTSLRKSGFSMHYEVADGKGKTRLSTIDIETFALKQPGCVNLECTLDSSKVNEYNFNTWPGFRAKRVPHKTGPDLFQESAPLRLFLSYIKEVICSEQEAVFKFVMSWVAGLVCNLQGTNRSALVLQAKPGSGKNSFIDFLRLVLGNHCVAETNGVETLLQKHNSILVNKRLVVVNEVASQKDCFRANWDRAKTLITDEQICIEPKGVDAYNIRNIGNYIFVTNHVDSILVEEACRRYTCIQVSEAHKNDEVYFKDLRDACFNQEVANQFYTYLLDMKEDEKVALNVPLASKLRDDMVTLSKSPVLRFIEWAVTETETPCSDNCEGFSRPCGHATPSFPLKSLALFGIYEAWCNLRREKTVSHTKFGMLLRHFCQNVVVFSHSTRMYERV